MKPSAHVVISAAAAAAAYGGTGSEAIGVSLFLGGVFIDLDHVSDYLLLSRGRLTVSNFFSFFYEQKWTRIFLPLHSYELIAALIAAALWLKNGILTGLVSGFAIHLICDQIWNMRQPFGKKMAPYFYFLTFRLASGFMKTKLLASGQEIEGDRLRAKSS